MSTGTDPRAETVIVYGYDLGTELYLRHQDPDRLEITADTGDQETTISLNLHHVRELRMILQRYEKGATL